MANTIPPTGRSNAPQAQPPTFEEWHEDLLHIPIEHQEYWIRESLRPKGMLHIFGRYFFPHVIEGIVDPPECHLELIKEMTSRYTSAIIFPREHAKSTWEKIDCIHDIVYALEPVILYIGATATDAGYHFEAIKFELEYNELLRRIYGDLVPAADTLSRKWTNRHLETTNRVNVVSRSRSKGRGVNIKNRRPTKIIIDDAEDDDTVKNPVLRLKFHDWLYNVILPSLDSERGFVKMIGTALHDLAEVVQFYEKHGGIFRRAIEDGKPIWPARWPLEKLAAKRNEIGTRAFLREYMNQSMPDEEAGIKREWIVKGHYITLPMENGFEGVIFIDPQSGESALADEYAITVLYSERGTPHRYVVEQPAGRASQFDQARELVRAWLRHKKIIRAVGIEKVLNQVATYQLIQDWKAFKINLNLPETKQGNPEWIDESDRNIPLLAWSPRGKDKLSRLQIFESDFERTEIHLRPELVELQNQLMFMGTGNLDHDDRADSLVGALEILGNRGQVSKGGMEKEDKKPYTGTIAGNLMKRRF